MGWRRGIGGAGSWKGEEVLKGEGGGDGTGLFLHCIVKHLFRGVDPVPAAVRSSLRAWMAAMRGVRGAHAPSPLSDGVMGQGMGCRSRSGSLLYLVLRGSLLLGGLRHGDRGDHAALPEMVRLGALLLRHQARGARDVVEGVDSSIAAADDRAAAPS